MKSVMLSTQFSDLVEMFEKLDMTVQEIEVSKAQAEQLAKECGVAHIHAKEGFCGTLYGVRLVVRAEPLTPAQRAAKQLRELADQLEKDA